MIDEYDTPSCLTQRWERDRWVKLSLAEGLTPSERLEYLHLNGRMRISAGLDERPGR